MRILEKYICDICGHDFASRKKCEYCEKSHVLIKDKEYTKGIWNLREEHPCKLDVTFENGAIIMYHR